MSGIIVSNWLIEDANANCHSTCNDIDKDDDPNEVSSSSGCNPDWDSVNGVWKKGTCDANAHPSHNIVFWDDSRNCLIRMTVSPDVFFCHFKYQSFMDAFENRRNAEQVILPYHIFLEGEYLGWIMCPTSTSRTDCYISEVEIQTSPLMQYFEHLITISNYK